MLLDLSANKTVSSGSLGDQENNFVEKILEELTQVSSVRLELDQRMKKIQASEAEQKTHIFKVQQKAEKNLEVSLQSAQRSQELSEDARQAKESASRGQNQVHLFFDHLGLLFAQVESSAQFMTRLAQEADRMKNLMESLTDIAELLKVLGINASIEAARAGQAGRGFAVVAKEVQELAGRAQVAASEASGIIGGLGSQIHEVDGNLHSAGLSVQENQNLGNALLKELDTITGINTNLEDQTLMLAQSIQGQSNFASEMNSLLSGLNTAAEGVQATVGESLEQGNTLKEVVNQVLALCSSKQVRFHEQAAKDIVKLARDLEALQGQEMLAKMTQAFTKYPHFSLLYVMDQKGIQLYNNVVNPKYARNFDSGGKNMDRSDRPYFTGVPKNTQESNEESPKVYISDLYISKANNELCLTASLRLADGRVLAGDMTLQDFLKKA